MAEMVEVVIDSVRVSLMSPQRLIVLRQTEGDRYLPIWVGPYEAESITVALQEIEMARPLTHDLLRNIFTTFNAQIRRVEIVALREDVFYGNIVIDADGQSINIDSRPSDAIALAVRAHVPILVDPAVMKEAGIIPEQDMNQMPSAPADKIERPALTTRPAASTPSPAPKPASGSSEDPSRLSIFEDFLNQLDSGGKSSDDDPEPPNKN